MAHDGEKGRFGLCGGLCLGQRRVEVTVLLLQFLRVCSNPRLDLSPLDELTNLTAHGCQHP